MTHSIIEWRNGEPYSTQFGDIYFSTENGIAESRHVFILHNHLAERWCSLAHHSSFTIAETGFGTGLNFLCAWQYWKQSAPASCKLHYVSVEKYPLTQQELQQALGLWPELAEFATALGLAYQSLIPGWNQFSFDHGNIRLTLIVGEAIQSLLSLEAIVDAWFLDGFAPSKNPEMWQPALFERMAQLSHAGTTFATFTSAGVVKRGLQAAGFSVNKVAGFGRKREMLQGSFATKSVSAVTSSEKQAIVIGGGIAGTASARALAERGWQVTLIERHSDIAQEASGNPVGVLYPRLTAGDTHLNRMALYGYLYSNRLLQQLALPVESYQSCGVLQLAFNAQEKIRQQGVLLQALPDELIKAVDAEQATAIAGVPLQYGGLFLPAAGWVQPPAFCRALATHPNIRIMTEVAALSLNHQGDTWQVSAQDKVLATASVVIIASANDTMSFPQSAHCELEPVRGQITLVQASAESQALKTVLCTDGYIAPARNGSHCIGATFSNGDTSLDIREQDHAENTALLKQISPSLQGLQVQSGRAALRCASADYLPLAGRLLDSAALLAAPPRHNANPATLPWLAGLYVNAGHGSKGLITAPLCAEIIACALNNEPAPVDQALMASLDPNRFLLRKMGLKRLLSSPYCKIQPS